MSDIDKEWINSELNTSEEGFVHCNPNEEQWFYKKVADGDIEAVMGAVPADQAVDIGNGITEIDLGYVIPGQVTSVAFVRTESSVGLEDAIGEADTIANSKARYIDTDDHEDSPKWQEAL